MSKASVQAARDAYQDACANGRWYNAYNEAREAAKAAGSSTIQKDAERAASAYHMEVPRATQCRHRALCLDHQATFPWLSAASRAEAIAFAKQLRKEAEDFDTQTAHAYVRYCERLFEGLASTVIDGDAYPENVCDAVREMYLRRDALTPEARDWAREILRGHRYF